MLINFCTYVSIKTSISIEKHIWLQWYDALSSTKTDQGSENEVHRGKTFFFTKALNKADVKKLWITHHAI